MARAAVYVPLVSDEMRSDATAWLVAAVAGGSAHLVTSLAWLFYGSRASGDDAFGLVIALLATPPIVTAFVGSLLLLSRRSSWLRALAAFGVLTITSALLSVTLVEVLVPGILPQIAIAGVGLGIILSPGAFGVGALVASRRRRALAPARAAVPPR